MKLLAGDGGLGTDLAGGDFDVLLLKGVDDVVGGEAAARHAPGVEPEAHGIFALAEDDDVGDAGDALEAVAHVDVEVIAHEERGVALIGRKYGGAEDEVLRSFGDRDSDLLDRVGEAALGSVDAVLYVDGGEVGVASDIEGGGDAADAVVGAGRGDVLHALGAVDLLLEGSGDSGFNGLGAGSGVGGGDGDLGRSEIGKLRDGERRNTDRAGKNDDSAQTVEKTGR